MPGNPSTMILDARIALHLSSGSEQSQKKIIIVNKNLLASLAHSRRALRAQLASLARMSAPRARDLMVVALRAPTYINFALRAQCCVLHSA